MKKTNTLLVNYSFAARLREKSIKLFNDQQMQVK